MKKDKLRNLDLRYFLLPFFILIALFFTMTYLNVDRRIKERYSRFENEAVSIAESYLHAILYSSDAHNIIEDLLDEKLRLAIHAISMIEDKYDNNVLSLIGERFLLDEIYLYNSQAEIIYSKDGRYLGWKAYEGHPVFDFYKGDKTVLVDDIRKDTESDEYYKYAYIKNEDGSFIQIGILSDTIQSFLQRFEIKELLNTLSNRSDIYDVVFINTDLELISGKTDSYSDILLEDEKIKEKILNGRHFTQRTIMKGQDVFLACVPVFYDGEIRGSFSVIWFTKELDAEVSKMIAESIVLFIAVIVILGTLLYYAYIKNKANIQIAYYDKLTGLPNYEFLIEFLDYEIRNMADEQKAIMLINCKNINFINMTYGFIYGNRILEEITKRIKEYIKPEDKLFRFGADRFVIFVADYRRKEELAELARGIVKIFDRPLSVSDNEQSIAEQYIDIQISIAEIKESCLSADRLLQDATLALDYINKNYSEQICFYEDIMEMSVYRQDRIEKALRAAINKRDNSSLYLQYQPKMSLKDNSLMGFEALARLNIDGMGSISPAEFINIAENMFLIYDLGKHILSEACRFLKRANDRLSSQHKRIKVSVNISVIQLLRGSCIIKFAK